MGLELGMGLGLGEVRPLTLLRVMSEPNPSPNSKP